MSSQGPIQPRSRHPKRRRFAFTLLELVIATSLAVTMLLIVWSLFSIYTKLEDKGERSATEMQLARSLFMRFRTDLSRLTTSPSHATTFSSSSSLPVGLVVADRGAPIEDGSELASSSANENRIRGDHPRLFSLPRVGFLRGDSRSLTMIVGYNTSSDGMSDVPSMATFVPPNPDFVGTVESNDGDASSISQPVWQVITYEFQAPFHSAASFSATGARASGTDFPVAIDSPAGSQVGRLTPGGEDGAGAVRESRLAGGLTRRTQSWLEWTRERRDASSGESPTFDSDSPASGIRVDSEDGAVFDAGVDEIPEVTNFRLRYFDGTAWTSSWDSDSRDGIPIAVEVHFELDGSRRWPREVELSEDEFEESAGRDQDTTVGSGAEFESEFEETLPSSRMEGESGWSTTSGSDELGRGSGLDNENELIGYRFVVLLRQASRASAEGGAP